MVKNFIYNTPTKVIFGKDTENQVGKYVKEQHGTKVLIHYGGRSAKESGLFDRIAQSLRAENIEFVSLGGVVPNPHLSLVYEGIDLCKKEKVDFLLAVGGGSVIDSTKAIGYGLVNEGDVWDFYSGKRKATACAPLGTVLTIASAGSEMSNSSVITKEEGWIKRGYQNDVCRPKFSILDPALTMTLPPYQTACGCTDIMMHTMERYFSRNGSMELTDGIAAALIKTVMHNAKILVNKPKNYEARAEIMWAGSLSHNGLTGCGSDGGDWATHKMEHELSGMFDVAHGAGLAALWGSWARYVYKEDLERFVQFAVQVMDVPSIREDIDIALDGIRAVENFYRSIHMPTSLRELGIEPTNAQIDEMAEKCSVATNGSNGVIVPLQKEDMIKIYKAANVSNKC